MPVLILLHMSAPRLSEKAGSKASTELLKEVVSGGLSIRLKGLDRALEKIVGRRTINQEALIVGINGPGPSVGFFFSSS